MGGFGMGNKLRLKKQQQYKKRYLPYKTVITKDKKTEIRYDYNKGLQGEVLNLLNRVGRANKFSQYAVGVIIGRKTRMPKSNYDWAKKGTTAWKLWELEAICNTFGIRIELKMPERIGDKRYSVKTEGSDNEFLILSSTNCPKFHITFRKDNLYDFHVDFSEDRHLVFLDASRKTWNAYYRYVKDICQWYFKRKSRKSEMPFDMRKFETLFKLKYLNNEIGRSSTSAIQDEAFWGEDTDEWHNEDEDHTSFLKLTDFSNIKDED